MTTSSKLTDKLGCVVSATTASFYSVVNPTVSLHVYVARICKHPNKHVLSR